MVLIRKLTLISLVNNVRIFAKYIPTKENSLSDSLSRYQMSRFWDLVEKKKLNMDQMATPIPEEYWPVTKIWIE